MLGIGVGRPSCIQLSIYACEAATCLNSLQGSCDGCVAAEELGRAGDLLGGGGSGGASRAAVGGSGAAWAASAVATRATSIVQQRSDLLHVARCHQI